MAQNKFTAPCGFIWNCCCAAMERDACLCLDEKAQQKTLINQAVDDISAMIASTDDEEIILAEFEKNI